MTDPILTIVLAIIAASPGLAALIIARRKNRADIATTYEAMATKQANEIMDLREKIKKLQDELDTLRDELEQYSSGVELLIAQLKANGMNPVWKPKKKREAAVGD